MAEAETLRIEIESLRQQLSDANVTNSLLIHLIYKLLIDRQLVDRETVVAHLLSSAQGLGETSAAAELQNALETLAKTFPDRQPVEEKARRPVLEVIQGGLSKDEKDRDG